jgi:hypothetical protein
MIREKQYTGVSCSLWVGGCKSLSQSLASDACQYTGAWIPYSIPGLDTGSSSITSKIVAQDTLLKWITEDVRMLRRGCGFPSSTAPMALARAPRQSAKAAAHNYTRSITGERPPKVHVRSSRPRRIGVQLSSRRSVSHFAQYESSRSVLLEPSVPGLAQSHVRTSTAALGLHGCLQCFPGSCALD